MPVTPTLGGGDRGLPGTCWPDNLAKLTFQLNEGPCLSTSQREREREEDPWNSVLTSTYVHPYVMVDMRHIHTCTRTRTHYQWDEHKDRLHPYTGHQQISLCVAHTHGPLLPTQHCPQALDRTIFHFLDLFSHFKIKFAFLDLLRMGYFQLENTLAIQIMRLKKWGLAFDLSVPPKECPLSKSRRPP